jgi:TPR repeat protein
MKEENAMCMPLEEFKKAKVSGYKNVFKFIGLQYLKIEVMAESLFLIILFVPSVLWGQTYLEKDEWQRAATKRLVKEMKASAKKGDAEAAFGLGNLFFNGKIIKKDNDEALKWFELAVKNGNNLAREQMGDVQKEMLANGIENESISEGEAMDLATAIGNCYTGALYYSKDSDYKKKILSKIFDMGEFWRHVDGVDNFLDLNEKSTAMSLYHVAANNGNLDASRLLGLYYEKTIKDYQKALKYFRIAADGGDFISQARSGEYLYDGNLVSKDNELAFKYLFLACLNPDEDDVVAFIKAQDSQSGGIMHRLAACYRYGLGTAINVQCAEYWDILSALYGDPNGQGILTFKGFDFNEDNPNIWSVLPKFIPVLKKASADNASAEVLYFMALSNSNDVSVSTQALKKLSLLIKGDTLNNLAKASVCDYLYHVYTEAAKNYPTQEKTLLAEAETYALKKKVLGGDEYMYGKWFLNNLRLSMKAF